MKKSTIGYALAAAALILTFSPETRNAVRRLAVRGTQSIMELKDPQNL